MLGDYMATNDYDLSKYNLSGDEYAPPSDDTYELSQFNLTGDTYGEYTPPEDKSWEITKGIKSGVDQLQEVGHGLVAVIGDVV